MKLDQVWVGYLVAWVIYGTALAVFSFFALPIVGRFVRLPTALVLVGVLVGIALNGIVFAFLAVPILSTLVITGGHVLSKIAQRNPFPGQTVPGPPEEGFFSLLLISGPTQSGGAPGGNRA